MTEINVDLVPSAGVAPVPGCGEAALVGAAELGKYPHQASQLSATSVCHGGVHPPS